MPLVRKGSIGGAVLALQERLNAPEARGKRPAVSESGTFDDATEEAVRRFQKAKRLPVTGVVDTATWRALGGE